MLETILHIASIICALSAVTTSLRAIGRAREYSSDPDQRKRLLSLHRTVTVIWFILSIIFVAPIMFDKWGKDSVNFIYALFFLLLSLVLRLIWRWVGSKN